MNYSFITPRLVTGGEIDTPADVNLLVAAGITHIIDCREKFDDGVLLAGQPTLAYLWNPTADDGQSKSYTWFQRSLDFALPALARPHTKVYAHCKAGINRGPSTAYAILRALGWSGLEAKTLIRLKRPITLAGIRYAGDADQAVFALGYTGSVP